MSTSQPENDNRDPRILKNLALEAVQQNAMERSCRFLPHGCRMFLIEQGWESLTVRNDPAVKVCETLRDLEMALRMPEVKVMFIPLGALMTDDDIEKLCQRNGVAKTIFKEGKKT